MPSNPRRRAVRVATLAAVVLGLAPAQAHAASALSGCFGVNGTAITGLSTDLQYLTTGGSWRGLPSSHGTTDARGCVRYTVRGVTRSYSLRIHGAGVVPSWNAVVDGATPHYASAGRRTYDLGTSNMRWTRLPAAMTTSPGYGVDTNSWLDQMTDGSACTNNPSPAMQVACYMDRHNMHGNVVVLDDDLDGVENAQDRYPQDPRYW
jgi:hypothetical protein